MRPPVFRLVLCTALFGLWMGYLGYLVLTRPVRPGSTPTPLVLSRPQIQASELDVIARIDEDPAGEVQLTIEKVLYAAKDGPKAGDKIRVRRLDECHPVQRDKAVTPPKDWAGKGEYLLPLRAVHEPADGQPELFEVAPVPPSPGFDRARLVRIYPATSEALAQYHRIAPPDKDGRPTKPPRP